MDNWHLLDFDEHGYRGISLQKAYDALKGKKSTTVIVAVIDSGIDTDHEDLVPNLWHNPNEIPYNNIDDDNNGLVDDVHGWNYLGGPNNENLAISVPEPYRTYHRFKEQFSLLESKDINENEKYVYKEWKRAKKIIDTNYNETIKNLPEAIKTFNDITIINTTVCTILNKHTFYYKNLDEKLFNQNEENIYAYNVWQKLLENQTCSNIDYLKDYENYIKKLENYIDQKTIPPIDYRSELLKDDSYDITKTHYGNNNLTTHSGYHGTSVSSIIGAVHNNDIGINGIADDVKIMMLRAGLGKDEFDKDVAIAIKYAVTNGAKVINISLGKSISPDKHWVDEAVQFALDNDVVIVHAAGNNAQNIDIDFNYTNGYNIQGLQYKNFLNVAASGDKHNGGLAASFTNFGKKMVDIFAPGVLIKCAIAGTGTQLASGTSMASPVVAGIVALLRSYFPLLSAVQIVDIIKTSGAAINELVQLPGEENKQINFRALSATGKIVNAYEAVKLAMKI